MATLTRQCWLFAVGSVFFAVATAPGFPGWAGAGAANLLCFIGSWFFTTAAWMQLVRADKAPRTRRTCNERSSALVQFVGTVLFNVSTGAAVWSHAADAERRYVWVPDVTGSLFFLVSGLLAMTAVAGMAQFRSRDWLAGVVNLIGCFAFGVSALAAFVRTSGVTEDEVLANLGTCIGAVCFLAAALIELPRKGSGREPSDLR